MTGIVGSAPLADRPDYGAASSFAIDPVTGNAYYTYIGAFDGSVYATLIQAPRAGRLIGRKQYSPAPRLPKFSFFLTASSL